MMTANFEPLALEVLRRRQGYRQHQLGQLVGKSQADISQYENGIKTPNPKTLVQLADLLGISCSEPNILLQPWRLVYADIETAAA